MKLRKHCRQRGMDMSAKLGLASSILMLAKTVGEIVLAVVT